MMWGRKTSSDLGEYRSCRQECPQSLDGAQCFQGVRAALPRPFITDDASGPAAHECSRGASIPSEATACFCSQLCPLARGFVQRDDFETQGIRSLGSALYRQTEKGLPNGMGPFGSVVLRVPNRTAASPADRDDAAVWKGRGESSRLRPALREYRGAGGRLVRSHGRSGVDRWACC